MQVFPESSKTVLTIWRKKYSVYFSIKYFSSLSINLYNVICNFQKPGLEKPFYQTTDFKLIKMVRRVFGDSGNTFKQLSVIFKIYIFWEIICLALRLE